MSALKISSRLPESTLRAIEAPANEESVSSQHLADEFFYASLGTYDIHKAAEVVLPKFLSDNPQFDKNRITKEKDIEYYPTDFVATLRRHLEDHYPVPSQTEQQDVLQKSRTLAVAERPNLNRK